MFTLAFVLILVVVLALIWVAVSSCNYLKTDEVGRLRIFGKIDTEPIESGWVFVPYFWGIDLVRIPKRVLKLEYEIKLGEGHDLYTSDLQEAGFDATWYFTLPYNESPSIVRMIEAGVPMDEAKLSEKLEDVLIPKVRQILSQKSYKELVANVDLTDINIKVNKLLHDPDGVLCKMGILGIDPTTTIPGTGQANLEIEVIRLKEELRKKLESSKMAELDVDIAKNTAKKNAEEVGGQILGIVARQHGIDTTALESELKAHPDKRGKSVTDDGYKETFEWAQTQTARDRVGAGNATIKQSKLDIDVNSGGKAIENPDFKGFAAMVAGGAAVISQFAESKENPKGKPKTPRK